MKSVNTILALNTAYFAAAAAATLFVLYEAFHYGFFLSPFPTILAVSAIAFMGACVIGARYLLMGTRGAIATPPLGRKQETAIRLVALFMPLAMFGYAGFKAYTLYGEGSRSLFVGENFIQCERLIFGIKRADDRAAQFAEKYTNEHEFNLAKAYAGMGMQNDLSVPWFVVDKQAIARRYSDRLDQYLFISNLENVERSPNKSASLSAWWHALMGRKLGCQANMLHRHLDCTHEAQPQ